MISFRLSAKEYELFRDFCVSRGAHSVSELARTAVNKLISDPSFSVDNVLEARVKDLESQLHLLALELKTLKQIAAPGLLQPLMNGEALS